MAVEVTKGQEMLGCLLANAITVEPSGDDMVDDSEGFDLLLNYEWVEGDQKSSKQGLPIGEVRDNLLEITDGWPKCAGGLLFAQGDDYQPRYLDSAAKLCAWIDEQIQVDWWNGSDAVSQERFFFSLQANVERFDSVSTLPHWPPVPGTFYMHPSLPEGDGSHLDAFVNFFSPLKDADRNLLTAFVMTPFWGGEPGSRPAWLITGDSHDPQQGRGIGKSKLVEFIGELCGGLVEVSPTEDIAKIKARLLSPGALGMRLARIDNVKTTRFSWGDLEGLITAPVISGHRLYQGEAQLPNLLTWALTLNGASLSKDMAQRCEIIKLERPEHTPTWEQDVRSFVREHRWNIIADIGTTLEK